MPIHTYFGAPGSGKTYELVNRVMVEAVHQGRTIYHNIPGISADKWSEEFGCDPTTIRYVSDDWFTDDTNFPSSDEDFLNGVGVIKGGELIICDEASTIVPKGSGSRSRVSASLDAFYRKHRHFTADVTPLKGGAPSRIAVDLYFATQDAASLHSTIAQLTGLRVDFNEMKALLGNKAYRALVYKSNRATKANRHGKPLIRRMKDEGFKRYSSFAGGVEATVAVTEDTGKIWTPTRIVGFALIPLVLLVAGWFAVAFAVQIFRPAPAKAVTSPATIKSSNVVGAPAAQPRAAAAAFDPAAQLKGECLQSLVDLEGRTYFDGTSWKPVVARDGRWYLGTCSVPEPRSSGV